MPVFKRKTPAWRRFIKKYHIPIALLAAMVVFWGNISWAFNGDVWRQFLSDYFPQYFPRPYVLVEHAPVLENAGAIDYSDGNTKGKTETIVKRESDPANDPVERRDLLSIPKLGLAVPIITAATDDAKVIYGLLDSGVVLYPGSAAFGTAGQTVILGHSAPIGWPMIKYDWVFSRINELKEGDMVAVTYNNETRYYSVVDTRIVDKQNGVPTPTVDGNSLALVSCWPPGKDLNRIVVECTIKNE